MSRVCDICKKGKMDGHKVSHSNKKSIKKFKANLQKTVLNIDGEEKKVKACTKCIKTFKKK